MIDKVKINDEIKVDIIRSNGKIESLVVQEEKSVLEKELDILVKKIFSIILQKRRK